jgi:hypothetical protein
MALRGGVTALFRAAREGDADEVARRLDLQPDLLEAQKPGYDRCPLLYEAAEKGRAGVVRLLLEKGADVNNPRQCGWAPIDAAAWYGHEEVVALLLEAGAEISRRRSSSKGTTLIIASSEGRLGVVQLLLKHMREKGLDERDYYERTALDRAFSHKHAEVVRVLLLAGADYAIADNYTGRTPRQAALQSRFHPCNPVFQVGALTVMPKCANHARDIIRTDLDSCSSNHGFIPFVFWQWWDGELERAYTLHRARRVHDDSTHRAQASTAEVPAYLRQRIDTGDEMPHVLLSGDNGKPTTRALAKRYRGGTGGELLDEEKGATLEYVMHDLAQELYTELLAGFHK